MVSKPYKPFSSDIIIKEDNKDYISCNLTPAVERPLYHVTREFNRFNMVDKKIRFIKSINENSLNSIDNFDSKFSDYLLRKNENYQKLKETLERRDQQELEREKEKDKETVEELMTVERYRDMPE
jgi:hypothetical protein